MEDHQPSSSTEDHQQSLSTENDQTHEPSFVLSSKNKKMLRDKDGFLFHIGKGDINYRLWRCEKRSCNSTACNEPEDE